jgi:hypothetical protein
MDFDEVERKLKLEVMIVGGRMQLKEISGYCFIQPRSSSSGFR